jgi:hypothetical protein
MQAELRMLGPHRDDPQQDATRQTELTIEVISLRIDFADDPAVLSLIRDISEQRLFMAKMIQMDRVIAIGTLVAGVGHEISECLDIIVAGDVTHDDITPCFLAKPL